MAIQDKKTDFGLAVFGVQPTVKIEAKPVPAPRKPSMTQSTSPQAVRRRTLHAINPQPAPAVKANVDVKANMDEFQLDLTEGLLQVRIGPGTRGVASHGKSTGHAKLRRRRSSVRQPVDSKLRKLTLEEVELRARQVAVKQATKILNERLKEQRLLADQYEFKQRELHELISIVLRETKVQDRSLVKKSRRRIRDQQQQQAEVDKMREECEKEIRDLKVILDLQQERLRKYSNEATLLGWYKPKPLDECKRLIIEAKEKRERKSHELKEQREAIRHTWEEERKQLQLELQGKLNILVDHADSKLICDLKRIWKGLHDKNCRLQKDIQEHHTAQAEIKKEIQELLHGKRILLASHMQIDVRDRDHLFGPFPFCAGDDEDGVLKSDSLPQLSSATSSSVLLSSQDQF